MKPTKIVAVDPSLHNLGFAVLHLDTARTPIVTQFTFRNSATLDYRTRAMAVCQHVAVAINTVTKSEQAMFVLECPTNWFTSKGMASKDNEAVQRLYFLAGMLLATAAHCKGIYSCWGIEPGQWKGTTPKPVMMQRAINHLQKGAGPVQDLNEMPSDAAEAFLLARHAYNNLIAAEHQLRTPYVRVHQDACMVSMPASFTTFAGELL